MPEHRGTHKVVTLADIPRDYVVTIEAFGHVKTATYRALSEPEAIQRAKAEVGYKVSAERRKSKDELIAEARAEEGR